MSGIQRTIKRPKPDIGSSESSSDDSEIDKFILIIKSTTNDRKHSIKARDKMCIRPFVSRWTTQTVERNLNIFYKHLVSGTDVLHRGGIAIALTDIQNQFMEYLKSVLHFSENLDGFRLYASRIKLQLTDVKQELLRSGAFKSNQMSLQYFIQLLENLCDKASMEEPEYGTLFTELVSRFAEVCLLMPYNHPERSCWEDFLGRPGFNLTSTPDLRFYRYGFDHSKSRSSFCVVQTNNMPKDTTEPCRKKQKKKFDSESETSGDDDIQYSRTSLEDRLKGRHAGALLVDLHTIVKEKHDDTCIEYSMPGMLVDGTRVCLTMLVISKDHYEKLKVGQELTKDDAATIYYSTFYDILLQSQRNDLIELFLCLNNMT
ncbi:uncharacterized protein LOC127717701 [Mytilus californianus]|uniref:uncharacterized protein LOC127717701 n=1 Tax=Mytilus californianus TaxID=6549 RepID=UPI00224555C7|nr:uncharacterized protein LOC127717701 [Mytilus californianus]